MAHEIRLAGDDDFFGWLPLFEAYCEFYDTELDDAKALIVWNWIRDEHDPLQAALAVDDEGTPVGLAHFRVVPDTLRATAVHGTVSFSGMLSDVWTIPDFYPMAVIPNGVRLTAYSGEASDLPASVLQTFLDTVAAGTVQVPIAKVYPLEGIVQAHRDMEDGTRSGKLVVTIR